MSYVFESDECPRTGFPEKDKNKCGDGEREEDAEDQISVFKGIEGEPKGGESEEDDDRELVLGYFGAGEFVGEMGLFVESDRREVILRTRTACELAEISYERLHQLFLGPLSADAPRLLYALGQQISKRLLDTSRKASRLAFLDVTDRIVRTLHDLAQEPEAMSHPQGSQLRVSRQELARLVGCSREMAGRVLKKLQADGLLHARGKTVVLYGTR